MTIQRLNDILNNLSNQASRDKVFEFAFALMEWMGVMSNSDKKPQLLTPQTQRLKDFLFPAPQTVQPQLYRLSAESQNIRIRFAVLKKLKKDHINQLVDNDPGLSSFQAFSKGLNSDNSASGFVPTQPYFIHFITTPDYNRLMLVFNQGDQKRIVSFRDRLTNTQYNKIILQWHNIASKSKPEIAELFWKSLDIKEVNKDFYKQIKERFDALLGIVKTQYKDANENQVKQFTVRLIGRYLFCWFLKEKGIISYDLIGKETISKTKNYYRNTLLKLFFETLNTKVQDRNPLTHEKLFEKIPYLNGGLFDESEEDRLFRKLDLDAWLIPFVEILESYDFTVDESSSQYQQVAVDPEMLGRIFENLLASQNEETEKLANQRKAFGAFYTPREIVDYMVNESIKSYLATSLNVSDEELAPIFAASPTWPDKLKSKKTEALAALDQIKILDPACGSGAFPMGILHKLVELHELVGTVKSSYELKKDILTNNIYGVDIMPMAIEIARLRAWLSLVLEEEYKPADPKHNFGVKPLPNFEFKFIIANTLVHLPVQKQQVGLFDSIDELDALKKLRIDYLQSYGEQKETIKKKFIELKDSISETQKTHGLKHDENNRAIKIARWDPFSNEKTDWFDSEWMFGIEGGFDVVLGNPPYVYRKANNKTLKKYFSENFKSTEGNFDLYKFFIEKAIQILRDRGVSCLIVPNTFLTAKSYNRLRQYIFENCAVLEIFDLGENVFEGVTVENVVIKLQRGATHTSTRIKIQRDRQNPFDKLDASYDLDLLKVFRIENSFNIYLNDNTSTLIQKIRKDTVELGAIAYCTVGINTGYIKDKLTAKSKIDSSYHKMLGGRDIGVNSVSWRKIWIKYDKEFVNSFGDKGRSLPPEYIFSNEKILVQRTRRGLKRKLVCYYDTRKYYNLNRLSNIVSTSQDFSLKYIHALLNSKLMDYYFNTVFNEYEVKPIHLAKLPIKEIPVKDQKPFIELVNDILASETDTKILENKIDLLVYRLYNLDEAEIKIIDPAFTKTKSKQTVQ